MLHRLLISFFLISASAASTPSAPQQSFRIAGVVVDSVSGAPLDRAELTISPVANLDQTLVSRTSSDGKFLFTGLPPGKYRLSASRSGYTQQGLDEHEGFMTAIAVGPKLDSGHIRFRLSRESVVAGNVSNDYGEPVRDAAVFLFQRKLFSGARSAHSIARATTNDLGNYRFAHLAPGTYSVAVYARPWYTRGSNYDRMMHYLQLLNTSRPTDTSIQLSLGDQADAKRIAESSSASFLNPLLDVVYPASFYSNADSLDAATPLTLAPGATITADFSLHAVPALRMFVRVPAESTNDPKPEMERGEISPSIGFMGPSLEVSLNVAGEEFNVGEVHPSTQLPGFFEITGVPPGEVVLSAASFKNGQSVSQARALQVSSDSRIDLLPQGPLVSISGSIASYEPPAAADDDPPQIKFTALDGHTSYSSSISAKGEFSLSVPAGQYQTAVTLEPSQHVGSAEATGATVSGHTITLAPGIPAKLVIHLTDANCTVTGTALKNGQPAAGIMILLVPEDASQDATLFHRDQSDSDGTFTVGQVLPGRYTLLAIENGWDLEWSSLSVLFKYLPNGIPITPKPGASISANPKVQ